MATLYTQAASNTRRTWIYLTGFFGVVIFIGWLAAYLMNDQTILYLAVILAVSQSFAAYWFSDKIVLSMANARSIEQKDNPQLYRLVENLCIAAGLPLPKIYIINESQPNAFATGRDKNHAVVAVTSGLLERLEKTELEGVIAHELSHIGNRDMFLGTVVVVLVGVISILSNMFLRAGSLGQKKDNDRISGILFILGIVAMILAPIIAQIIQLAISRKREFLADADGALLTRYPEGLARALQKISSDPSPMESAHNTTAHLYIANPLRGKQLNGWIAKLFSTHPPIEERVKALMELSV
ncbi:MAG TPA: M48 family metallopeptidase [Candidatus Paceibacterota bacterium]|nr:M48 family metallopeptidase [Candidatus Pacearchaeota archaeon]HRZ50845.1 M48 family metallopeptidase [Candidatus Paceibacterota bacterium]HSA36566.1 M48 family metallopeptidase [Candidatus Paceibacterota bacterium]